MKPRIRVGDEVKVIAGKEKGRTGLVLDFNIDKLKIRVKDVRVQTLFDKKDGMKKKEGFIDYSNVKLVKKSALKPNQKTKEKTGLFAKTEKNK